jgi:hypothetical protein
MRGVTVASSLLVLFVLTPPISHVPPPSRPMWAADVDSRNSDTHQCNAFAISRRLSGEDNLLRPALGKRITSNARLEGVLSIQRQVFARHGFGARVELTWFEIRPPLRGIWWGNIVNPSADRRGLPPLRVFRIHRRRLSVVGRRPIDEKQEITLKALGLERVSALVRATLLSSEYFTK